MVLHRTLVLWHNVLTSNTADSYPGNIIKVEIQGLQLLKLESYRFTGLQLITPRNIDQLRWERVTLWHQILGI